MGINETGLINEAVNRQIASDRDPANKSPTTGSLAAGPILTNPSSTPEPVNSLINSSSNTNSVGPVSSTANSYVNPAVPVEALSVATTPVIENTQQITPAPKVTPELSSSPDITPLITETESNVKQNTTEKGEIIVLSGKEIYNAESMTGSPILKIGSEGALGNLTISNFLQEGKAHLNSVCMNISEQGSSKLAVNGDLDFAGKNLSVMIQPGHYKSGQKYELINTVGTFNHDISEAPNFELYNMNRQDLKYNSGLQPDSIAKITYNDHGASFEFIRDISVTYSGFVEPNFNSEL